MRRPAVLLCSLVVVGAVECTAGPHGAPLPPLDYYFTASPEQVWNALLLVYTDLKIPLEHMDKSSWLMRSQQMTPSRTDAASWVDCGRNVLGPITDQADLTMSLTTLLRAAGDSTAMRLILNVSGTMGGVLGNRVPVSCVSNGVLEHRVIDAVRQRVQAARP